MKKGILMLAALTAALALSFIPSGTIQKKCVWLRNNSFEICGPRGCTPAAIALNEPSAAAGWTIHNDNQGRLVQSSVLNVDGAGRDGKKMLKIGCQGNESGVYQIFKPNCKKIRVTASVRVWSGKVMLFVAKDGYGNEHAVSNGALKGRWQTLELKTSGKILNNWVGVYNTDLKGGKFDIDYVCIEPLE